MKKELKYAFLLIFIMYNTTHTFAQNHEQISTEKLLRQANRAICYGGYRTNTRANQPSISQIKEDLKILQALNIKMVRMYNVHLPETENTLKAIQELKKEDKSFEMHLMLGAWIDCKNAWTEYERIRSEESERNEKEIKEAVRLAKNYPEIVKIIAVGNEAMVKWANEYYVEPEIILKWVEYLQDLKKKNQLAKSLWITSSDNFASWGGELSYHNETLEKLCRAVDYISIHTYPMHDTYYNSVFWGVNDDEKHLSQKEQLNTLMYRAVEYAQNQYKSVQNYLKSHHIDKPIHIGETGWATKSGNHYGNEGSMATDEYKEAIYYHSMMEWSQKEGMTIFYFEAFDENWKDANHQNGSENHFGLFTIDGKAKYALWDEVDKGKFKNLSRDGNPIAKTYNGDEKLLFQDVKIKYRN
jgi:exo-beta-1,3-glucanase (GH17 family)